MEQIEALQLWLGEGGHGEAMLALGIITLSFLVEDGAALLAGLLAARGDMTIASAFLALWAGLWMGDNLLYGTGRLAGHSRSPFGAWARRRLGEERLAKGEAMLVNNLVGAVFLARAIPGLRLATYTAAGFLRVAPLRFILLTLFATFLWAAMLFSVVYLLGEAALHDPRLWAAFVAVALAGWLGQRLLARLQRRRAAAALGAAE